MTKYLILVLAFLSAPLAARADYGGYHMMDWGGGWGGWAMFIFPLFWIIVLGGLFFLATKAFSRNNERELEDKHGRALDILKERYARGEIDKKEFEEKKKDLK